MLLLKKIAAQLPSRWQALLKRFYFEKQIKNGTFITDEPEYKILHNLINPGDWVIDVGANVGHYTKRFSELVGTYGRVIAFEPMPTTFSLLSANVELFANSNVSLFNSAVSNKLALVGISTPKFSTGLTNYYEASLSSRNDNCLSVLTVTLDSIFENQRIALVKIDVEGHEAFVLAGMRKLIEASKPIIILETGSKKIIGELEASGYDSEKLPNSPNVLFTPVS